MVAVQFKKDAEFQKLLPALDEETKKSLEASLMGEGCRDALVVWKEKKILLDGHNRLGICNRKKIPYKIKFLSFESRLYAKVWVLKNQRDRRNLDSSQLAMVGVELEETYAELAEERKRYAGKIYGRGKEKVSANLQKPIHGTFLRQRLLQTVFSVFSLYYLAPSILMKDIAISERHPQLPCMRAH